MTVCRAVTSSWLARLGTLCLRNRPRQVGDVSLAWIRLETEYKWSHDKLHVLCFHFAVWRRGLRGMINCVCVRIAVNKERFRRFILRASMSSIATVLLLSARRFGKSLRTNGWGCNDGVVNIDALIACLAGPFREEDTRAVMMVLAFIALVACPVQDVFA